MTDFLDIDDVDRDWIETVFETTDEVKAHPEQYHDALEQQTLLMLFAKPSTRTRISFEAGMTELGGHAIYFAMEQSQMSRGESTKDTANVIGRYVDGVMARLFAHDDILAVAEHSDAPVINGLTDLLHPCQAMADVYTMREHGIDLGDADIAYVGDGNNVCHSLMQICAALGATLTVSTPQQYAPDEDLWERATARAADSGGALHHITNPEEAVDGADVVYTDVWVSMGDEHREQRLKHFQPYQVDRDLLERTDDAYVMHPLPAHRGEEVTSAVLDSDASIVYDQAENRKHVQKAIMLDLMG